MGWARSADSNSTSKIAPTWDTTRSIRRPQALIGKGVSDPRTGRSVFDFHRQRAATRRRHGSRQGKAQGVPLQNLFETMQIYLGSLYVNDFNRFGRTYQVIAQADAQFRDRPEDITRLKTRNAQGQMVPLGIVGESEGDLRPGPRDALQRLSRRGNQRRAGAGFQFRPGRGNHGQTRDRELAARAWLRMDRVDLSDEFSRAIQPSMFIRFASCWFSWCWRRNTRASGCRWRSS